jgi:hypothetical protein
LLTWFWTQLPLDSSVAFLHSFTGINSAASDAIPSARCTHGGQEALPRSSNLLDTEDDVKVAPDFIAPEEFAEVELAPDSATFGDSASLVVGGRRAGVVHSSVETNSIYGDEPQQRGMQS